MTKFRRLMSLTLVLAVAGVSYGGNAQSIGHSHVHDEAMMCDMPGMAGMSGHDHHAMMAHSHNMATMAQDDNSQSTPPSGPGLGGQPGDTLTHRLSPGDGCSAVNPRARDKSRDGVKANTVGCKCVRKCANGQTQEDLSKDDKGVYICKNACHKDRCSCPDPCKT